jgi:thiamine biosynthesis lipoprotein
MKAAGKSIGQSIYLLTIWMSLFIMVHPALSEENPAWSGEAMGSTYAVKVVQSTLSDERLEELKAAIENRLQEINREMSTYQPDSELSQFNQSTSTAPFKVSASLADIVRFALHLNQRSGGAFDPTLAPLFELWGFGAKDRFEKVPSEEEIAQAKALTGCLHLTVTDKDELRKDIPQLRVNLNAVGNGYGADEVVRIIRSYGISNMFVEVAGEVAVTGLNPHREKWRVGIDVPTPGTLPGENLQAILHLSNQAVATSGDYRNFVADEKGNRYSHIFNPLTGRPITHNLASVTVVATNCLLADGLSTTLFVMGAEAGKKWIEQFPDASALFTVRNPDGTFTQILSKGFQEMTDCEFPSNPSEL